MYSHEYSVEDFFGKEKKEFLSYEELKKIVKSEGILGRTEYNKVQKNHPNWPSHPWKIYSNEYLTEDFFGPLYLSYIELRTAVQVAGITKTTEYDKEQKNNPNWPSNIYAMYTDEYSYSDFFGSRYLSYIELRTAVQAAGISNVEEYKIIQKNHPNWPSNLWNRYAGEYSNEDFFGKYLSYQALRAAVQAAGIISQRKYNEAQKSYSNWPSTPWYRYAGEYSNEDFFEKTKRRK
jgi:phage gp16-like protein